MERHQSQDPKLTDVEGMKVAAYAADTDVTPGSKIGASMLPHVAPACASLMMAITQATDAGLLPKDPGTPWRINIVREEADKALARAKLEVSENGGPFVEMKKDADGFIRPVESSLDDMLTRFNAPPVIK